MVGSMRKRAIDHDLEIDHFRNEFHEIDGGLKLMPFHKAVRTMGKFLFLQKLWNRGGIAFCHDCFQRRNMTNGMEMYVGDEK